ncbi:drainin [Cavenderia fasciculata]|uniref:Drainin n=1 Tax=Cavenderia fasciculata TaxID=261658 RepID=F4QBT7_CACFS|nr:drainin [Cavenderia fasciculata]EGG14675.1 drainin [Cavenderia fasciculata]|eukprot:XP_004351183.1 drainin [Cavenderia fasciculata]
MTSNQPQQQQQQSSASISGSSSNSSGNLVEPNYQEMLINGTVEKMILNPNSLLDRPSQLPPKSQEEILKHQREYEEIQKKAKKTLEKEAKEKEKVDKERKEKEKLLIEARKIWEEEIIPSWDKKRDTKRIKEISWRGLPPAVRGKIWRLSIGNDLRITQDLFNISLGHANNALLAFNKTSSSRKSSPKSSDIASTSSTPSTMTPNGKTPLVNVKKNNSNLNLSADDIDADDVLGLESTSLGMILQDIQDTFPSLLIFQKGGPLHSDLIDVLGAYICNRPDIGYVPGMTFLGAMFLLNMEKYDAFQCLSNHINKNCYRAFFRHDLQGIPKYLNAMDGTVEALLPKLHKHFKSIGISAKHYLVDWITTLFSKALPLDISTRVWDLVFIEGEVFIFRTSLAILRYFITDLDGANYDECIDLFTRLPQRRINENQFFDEIAAIVLDQKKVLALLS